MDKEHLAVMIRERVKKLGPATAMRYKDRLAGQWKDISWTALGERIEAVAKGLIDLGVSEGDRVGIFSQNKPEWAIADYGIQSVGAVSVPIYATNSASQARFIVDKAEIGVIFVGGGEQYERARSIDSGRLQKIITFEEDMEADPRTTLSFKDFLDLGRRSAHAEEVGRRIEKASSKDLATIIYTSGTTGEPKGVMLTHANFFHQVDVVGRFFKVDERDVSLCFLPLSHVFERSWSYFVLCQGAMICYCDEPKKAVEYIQEVKPTAMVAVPRLYEKIHAAVVANMKGLPERKRKIFLWALDVGRSMYERMKAGKPVDLFLGLKHELADRLVLRKIQDIFGGRVRFMVSGGAPLSKEIAEFFRSAGILICEGYGLTETSPTITCNTPVSYRFGTVGKVVPRCEVKLSGDGEILVRGDNVTSGYYKSPDATEQAFEDGWFKTGDVGEFDEEGFLKITDRIKDLIITSGGKNISPQNVELSLSRDEFIEQVLVIGDGKNYLSALIVPAFEALEKYAQSSGISFSSREDMVASPEILSFYEKRIAMQSKELGDYEKVKKFLLLPHEFSLETGEMTPTLKLKRKVIHRNYSEMIESMYGG